MALQLYCVKKREIDKYPPPPLQYGKFGSLFPVITEEVKEERREEE